MHVLVFAQDYEKIFALMLDRAFFELIDCFSIKILTHL